MTKDDMLALADRCEKATGPDRELDLAIANALGGQMPSDFTSSIDAAATLRPDEGMEFGCGSKDESGSAWAWVGQFRGPLHIEEGEPATPALALCAAALRAKAAQQEDQQ